MEKYKDLIITLIKNHRKYQGCEDILDEIVEEVISKAKTVVENVSDETTVRNYLIKTVSTAMIIVPKRHNISTRMIRRSALSGMILPKSMTETSPEFDQEDILQQLEDEAVENNNLEIEDSITEQMLDNEQTVENDTPILEEAFDYKEEEEEKISPIIEESNIEEVTPILEEELEFEKDSTDLDGTPILDETDVEQPVLEEPATEDNKYDNTLVDRMINEIAPEDSGIVYDENENNDVDELETLLDSENIDSLEIQEDEIQELNEPEEQIDDIAVEHLEEEEEDDLNTDESTSDDEIAYTLPNLEVFKAKPIDNPIDVSEIRSDLSAFIEKHPDMYYGEIWKLKYVENKSADSIAEILNLDADTVLERLEDLISVVED